jgi:hypothetical protein
MSMDVENETARVSLRAGGVRGVNPMTISLDVRSLVRSFICSSASITVLTTIAEEY